MTHRSPYHMFAGTVLAALAIAVGATLAAPGKSAALAAMEPAPQENLAPVPSPASAVSAAQMSQFESGITESSGIAAGLARDPVVHLARSTRSLPGHAPLTHEDLDATTLRSTGVAPMARNVSGMQDEQCLDLEGLPRVCTWSERTWACIQAVGDRYVQCMDNSWIPEWVANGHPCQLEAALNLAVCLGTAFCELVLSWLFC